MQGIIQALPGGRNCILFGGTRQTVKMGRSWQVPLDVLVNLEKCRICNESQEEFPLPDGSPDGWRVLTNTFTPHDDHLLVVPTSCWPVSKLQRWGGGECIGEALRICALLMQKREPRETMLLVNVGAYVGGSLGHPHMHIFPTLVTRPLDPAEILRCAEARVVHAPENEQYLVVASGARAGECMIVARQKVKFSVDMVPSLAQTISEIVDMGNREYMSDPIDMLVTASTGRPVYISAMNAAEIVELAASVSGGRVVPEKKSLPPSYGVTVRIAADGNFRYADYCPVLHQWGPTEYVVPVLEGAPFILPWSHEATAAMIKW